MRTFRITVTGLVQGIGYRPFVAELAEELALSGQVKNCGGIVKIIAAGEEKALEQFVRRLNASAPEGAEVHEVKVEGEPGDTVLPGATALPGDIVLSGATALPGEPGGSAPRAAFRIVESAAGEEEYRLLPPDFPVCDNCLSELFDKKNRRYRYPFISCVSCGPRFSILKGVPYDRDTITMERFAMCPECEEEYHRKGDRRRHAQTIACHDCGPVLRAVERAQSKSGRVGGAEGVETVGGVEGAEGGETAGRVEGAEGVETAGRVESCASCADWRQGEVALGRAVEILREGGIVAVKDIGGFHFAFRPDCEEAAQRLREFKNREKKPFAVMFPDVEAAREYCVVREEEKKLLQSAPRPIVLLDKKKDFAPGVCGDSDRMGVLLPCNPLQVLLLREVGPLVMTSGNRGGEPIITEDEKMEKLLLAGCPDMMLTHDREILTPLEDSICQVTAVGTSILRRGRGHVPEPIWLPRKLPAESYAAGGDLKAVFALGKGKAAYLSSHFGDLEDYCALKVRNRAAEHMAELFSIEPEYLAADFHPAYHAGKEENFKTKRIVKIQHHHAHILSVMAEHGLAGPVLGIAFDGTGYGGGGEIWGGEFLLCERNQMKRVGHLAPINMVGGDGAAKDAKTSLLCYLLAASEAGILTEEELSDAMELPLFVGKKPQCAMFRAAREHGVNTFICTSMGRLFDAVSALLGFCAYNSYEGECAVLLEQAARRGLHKMSDAAVDGVAWQKIQAAAGRDVWQEMPSPAITRNRDDIWQIDSVKLIAELYRRRKSGEDAEILAAYFHLWIVAATEQMCSRLREEYNVRDVALSGGSFCNRILLEHIVRGLQDRGFAVYRNEQVPCGDGGLALGQLYALMFVGDPTAPETASAPEEKAASPVVPEAETADTTVAPEPGEETADITAAPTAREKAADITAAP